MRCQQRRRGADVYVPCAVCCKCKEIGDIGEVGEKKDSSCLENIFH